MPPLKRPTPKSAPTTAVKPPTVVKTIQCPACDGKGVVVLVPRQSQGTQFADSLMDALGVRGENRLMLAVTLDAIDVRMSAYDRKFLTDLFLKAAKEKR